VKLILFTTLESGTGFRSYDLLARAFTPPVGYAVDCVASLESPMDLLWLCTFD
jgi:hypothetical protein